MEHQQQPCATTSEKKLDVLFVGQQKVVHLGFAQPPIGGEQCPRPRWNQSSTATFPHQRAQCDIPARNVANVCAGNGHERNFVGNTGDESPHFFRPRGHNMPCRPHIFRLGFVFGEVSKLNVTFITFCVKSFSC